MLLTTHDIVITGTIPTSDSTHIEAAYEKININQQLAETMFHNTYDEEYNDPSTTLHATVEIQAETKDEAYRQATKLAKEAGLKDIEIDDR